MVFVRANQNKLQFDRVAALQKLGDRAEYVKIKEVGAMHSIFTLRTTLARSWQSIPRPAFTSSQKTPVLIRCSTISREQNILAARLPRVSRRVPFLKALDGQEPSGEAGARSVARTCNSQETCKPASLETLTGSEQGTL